MIIFLNQPYDTPYARATDADNCVWDKRMT